MKVTKFNGVLPTQRINCLRMLAEYHDTWMDARDVEATVHALSTSNSTYIDKIQQIIWNLRANPKLTSYGVDVAILSDASMAEGTIIQDIENESRAQRVRFNGIVQEKYELVNKASYRTTLKCRRCGSDDIACEQKQTRGADESMTVFCTCSKCTLRWTMR